MSELDFKTWFVAERAKALAGMWLTRRDDLEVRATKAEAGLEYVVRIKSDDHEEHRQFGIVIKATMSVVSIDQANAQLRPTIGQFTSANSSFPVCVFFLMVKDDKGYFTWELEPVIREGQPKLQANTRADCRVLNDGSIESIVAQVKSWYAALAESFNV